MAGVDRRNEIDSSRVLPLPLPTLWPSTVCTPTVFTPTVYKCSVTFILLLIAGGCTQEMYDQPRIEPFEATGALHRRSPVQPVVPGTVARGQLWRDEPFFTGMSNNETVTDFPADPRTDRDFRLTSEMLERGRQRFDIFCSHCHGRTGDGDGMVVRRGFRQPPSLHESRLREETPPGHYFQVITDGFKTMPAQRSRIPVADRWAIVAYVRALQRSQHVLLSEAPSDIRKRFEQQGDG